MPWKQMSDSQLPFLPPHCKTCITLNTCIKKFLPTCFPGSKSLISYLPSYTVCHHTILLIFKTQVVVGTADSSWSPWMEHGCRCMSPLHGNVSLRLIFSTWSWNTQADKRCGLYHSNTCIPITQLKIGNISIFLLWGNSVICCFSLPFI